MSIESIGIVGAGTVGGAMVRLYSEYVKTIKVYDTNPERATVKSLDELSDCELIFLCLPTPYEPGRNDYDLSAITRTLTLLKSQGSIDRVVIRSTLKPGTMTRLSEMFQASQIVYYPEFGTARCMDLDFQFSNRHIIGINSAEWTDGLDAELVSLLQQRYGELVAYDFVYYAHAETCKLATNAYFAHKVAFFNQLKQTCDAHEIHYETVRGLMAQDHRIGITHTMVPGPDRNLGFGGHCLPKDLEAYSSWILDKSDEDLFNLSEMVLSYNRVVRSVGKGVPEGE